MRFSARIHLPFAAASLIAFQAAAQDPLLEQAARLDSEHKCGESESLYRQALAAAPSSPAVLNNLGNHYLACDAAPKAQVIFERILKLKPTHVNASLQLARLATGRHEGAKALNYLARINARDTSDPEIALVRAEALAQSGQRSAATSLIHQIAGAGTDPRVLYSLGMVCARAGFYADAENAFSRVLAQVPDDFDVLYNFGLAAARCGHLDKARTSFESALKDKPTDTDTLYELGRVATSSGDYNRAVYVLAQATKAAPGRPEIALALARATQMGGYYGDSLLAYDRYLALRPEDEMVKRDRALVAGFTRTGRSAARVYLQSYVEKHPADAIGLYDLAQLSYRENRSSALSEVSRALQLNRHFEQAFFFRAWLHNKAGRYEESLRDARMAVSLNLKDARALDLVGLDNLELHQPAQAEKPLREAVALSPAEPEFLFHLGRCLLEQGQRDEARPILADFQKLRQKWTPSPREDPNVIESATLSPDQLARRVIEDYENASRANPNESAIRLNLSRALLGAGQTDEALDSFRQLLKMEPPAAVSQEAGTLLLQSEQYGLAGDFLKRSTAEIPLANLELAIVLYFTDRRQEALETLDLVPNGARQGDYQLLKAVLCNDIESLTGKQPVSNGRLLLEGVSLLARRGDLNKALALTEQAPDDAQIALTRVALMSRLHREQDAQRTVREVERRWPQWDRPYAAEALLLGKLGRTAEAKSRFEIASTLGPADPLTQCLAKSLECTCLSDLWAKLLENCSPTQTLR